MKKWVELKNNDVVYFNSKTGTGSIVTTEKHGNYFMPAKIGMRLKGEKKPIRKFERFTFSNARVQKVEGNKRIAKCMLIRELDGKIFAISEENMQKYFGKSEESNLGGYDL